MRLVVATSMAAQELAPALPGLFLRLTRHCPAATAAVPRPRLSSGVRHDTAHHDIPRHVATHKKAPGSYSGGRSFSGAVAVVVARKDPRGDPRFHRRAVPGDTTSTEL